MKKIKTIGILGGGQLGRMMALAAARLGLKAVFYCPEQDAPASHVGATVVNANYFDQSALQAFSSIVDVVTYEFENIPVETARQLEAACAVYPKPAILEITQDRLAEKAFLGDIDIPTTAWAKVENADDILLAMNAIKSGDIILKTTRMGYDGKGQKRFSIGDDPQEAWSALGETTLIAENVIDFECEISVIVARDLYGNVKSYDPSLNDHKNFILHTSTVPAGLNPEILEKAQELAEHIATQIDLIGVMGVEMFVTKSGEILVNELAPRPHNSGHWTIDACVVSQFEQHMRAVAGLPLGETTRHSDCVMTNLLGADINKCDAYLQKAGSCVHIYGKSDVKEGRKMGHVTELK